MSDNNPKSKPLLEDELAEEDRREQKLGLPYGEIYDTRAAAARIKKFREYCKQVEKPN